MSVLSLTLIVIGSIVASSAVSFIAGIFLGFIGGLKYRKQPMKEGVCLENDSLNLKEIKGPVYDEVTSEQNIKSINLEPNIAYGQVKNFDEDLIT